MELEASVMEGEPTPEGVVHLVEDNVAEARALDPDMKKPVSEPPGLGANLKQDIASAAKEATRVMVEDPSTSETAECSGAKAEAENAQEKTEDKVSDAKGQVPDVTPADGRPKAIAGNIRINEIDSTLNVIAASGGALLTSFSEGVLKHFMAGVRATAGIINGRYMFEVRLLESRASDRSEFFRVGFSTRSSSLFLADHEDSFGFDSLGYFANGKEWMKHGTVFGRETFAVILDLGKSNSVSLFRDGLRSGEPQKLPDRFKGKALYPTITFKGVTLQANFGPLALAPLPCRMLSDAATDDVELALPSPRSGKYDVVFPIGLPGQGAFDWLDFFREDNPDFHELSGRACLDWARRSMTKKQLGQYWNGKGSKDKPGAELGHFDVSQWLSTLAPLVSRNYIMMELQSNLFTTTRIKALEAFGQHQFRRVAVVIIGEPSVAFKEKAWAKMLAEKKAAVQTPTDGDVTLSESEKSSLFSTGGTPDMSKDEISKAFATFSLPDALEGFDEIRYEWQPKQECSELMRRYIRDCRIAQMLGESKPSAWFTEKWEDWQNQMETWKTGQESMKIPEELNADETDVFLIKDILEIGTGLPLFAYFELEDWALLKVRMQLHLLLHTYRRDVDDIEIVSFHEAELDMHFQRHFAKAFDFKQFAMKTFGDLADIIKDTLTIDKNTGHLQSHLAEAGPLLLLVQHVEAQRRVRKQLTEAGDESACLKFPRPPKMRLAEREASPPRRKRERGVDHGGDMKGEAPWKQARTTSESQSTRRLGGYWQILEDKNHWRDAMEVPAERLQRQLNKASDRYFTCMICDCQMRQGADVHLPSVSHWDKLLQSIKHDTPSESMARGLSTKWVQSFRASRGRYFYNHLTGEQDWDQ